MGKEMESNTNFFFHLYGKECITDLLCLAMGKEKESTTDLLCLAMGKEKECTTDLLCLAIGKEESNTNLLCQAMKDFLAIFL